MSNDDGMESNTSGNATFEEVVETRISRRGLLGGGLAAAVAASVGGLTSLLKAVPAAAHGHRALLGFEGIPTSTADAVVVAAGYTARVLIAWGDPISSGPAGFLRILPFNTP